LLEPKLYYRRMDALLERLPGRGAPRPFAERLLPRLVEELGDALGIRTAQLYAKRRGRLALLRQSGVEAPDLAAEIERRLAAAGAADGITGFPWAGTTAAGPTALLAGPGGSFVIALGFDAAGPPPTATQMHAVVSPLHYAIAQHLRERELRDLLEQARAIQTSLLPPGKPGFADFDIAAVSLPARVVGGDLYDFLPLDADTLAITIADASGHGLPAALQARDVVTGLRMGVERDLKIPRTVEKLNRVIHRSGLVSRFVSLVFGEIEANGNLSYINGGHPAPLLLDDRGVHELSVGGMILGPDPAATYKLGFTHIDRGAALVLFTDGVIERGAGEGEAFGVERVTRWLRDWRDGPAERAVADLAERVRAFGGDAPPEDDITIVYVRRPR
jgi:sigma-B regulation protein RsbU (phosphoserine phosphatase)